MTGRNYKHSYEVKIQSNSLLEQLPMTVLRQRFDLIKEWLGHHLVSGQDWSFDVESDLFQVRNTIIYLPISIWFDREEDVMVFKLKFGL